jgi:hypothetical protein
MKSDVDKVTEETISNGGVLAKLYFDMRHTEREKLQPLMIDLINERLMKEKGVVYCYGAIEEPIENGGMFVTSGIVTVLFEKFFALVDISFRYAPAGIEILKPSKEMRFTIAELQSMLMDVSNISMTYSKFVMERVLKKEDLDNMMKHLADRESIGKRFLDEGKKKESGRKEGGG